jgi:hypothetical protein
MKKRGSKIFKKKINSYKIELFSCIYARYSVNTFFLRREAGVCYTTSIKNLTKKKREKKYKLYWR